MLAVIQTGGKQYLVSPGEKIKIEKINGKKGDQITFTDVLMLEKNKKVEIGSPILKNAKVVAEITNQGREDKIIVFKYKAKKRYKKKKGHKQPFTEIKIKDIRKGKVKKTTTKKPSSKKRRKQTKKPTKRPVKKSAKK